MAKTDMNFSIKELVMGIYDSKFWQKWYEEGIPKSFDYLKVPLKDQFLKWVEKHPDKIMIYSGDRELSYSTVNDTAVRLAKVLLDLGVKKGDRVALGLPNIPEFIIACHACMKIGAILVPMNPLYTVPELTFFFTDSGAETVITVSPVAEKFRAIKEGGESSLDNILVIQVPGKEVVTGVQAGFIDLNEAIWGVMPEIPDRAASVEEIVSLQYTGGTTGVPKGCCLSNANFITVSTCYLKWASSLISSEHYKCLCTVPLYHIYGINTTFNFATYTGGSIVLIPEVTPDNIIAAINRYEPTFWPTVPTLLHLLTLHPELKASRVKSIQCILSGSAPLPEETMRTFEEISGAKILEGYGGSETTNGITTNPVNRQKVRSVGVPFPDIACRVVDLEKGTDDMPIGEPGELIFKGPLITEKYWNNPEETAIAIRDGWLYTGDIGYMDEDGYIFIVDRKKDMIICSGFNVYPRDIDEVLFAHPKILEGSAIGIPDAKRGETIKVFVVTKPGETLNEDEVIEWCRQSLAPYKVPTQVEFIDQLPRTNVNKIDRKELRKRELGGAL